MDELNIKEALAEVPKLVELNKTVIEENAKLSALVAKALQHQVQATIPPEQIVKLTNAIKGVVEMTPCATPDTSESAEIIAKGVLEQTKASVEEAVKEKIASIRIKLDHNHTYLAAWDMAKLAEKKTRSLLAVVCVLCGILFLGIVANSIRYYRSDMYWAGQYKEVLYSKYITEPEKEILMDDAYSMGALPKEFFSNPSYAKAKIRQNQSVIKARRKEARTNKGQYSTSIPIER